MELVEYIKHVRSIVYSALINYSIAVPFYIFLCGIPFAKMDLLLSFGFWFVNFGFLYLLYFLISLVLSEIKIYFLSIIALLIATITFFTFYYFIDGYFSSNSQKIISILIFLLLSADIPYLVSILKKKC